MNEICKEIAEIEVSGNIIPLTWLENIRYTTEKGTNKSYTLAILILSDIMYWYKPYEIRDEQSGLVVDLKQKFSSDKLQKSYQQYAELFGSTKRAVKKAIDFLENNSYISREFRNINVKNKSLNNVMYIEPNPDKIKEITSYKKVGGYKKVQHPPTKKCNTYTETTHSEITHEIKKLKIKKKQMPYYSFVNKIRKWADKYKDFDKPFVLKFNNKLYDFEYRQDGNHYLRNFKTKKILSKSDAEYIYKILNHRQEIPIYKNICKD